jgi:hypothetical protein
MRPCAHALIRLPGCSLPHSAGLTVEEAVVFLDRQQGGRQRLAALENGLAVTVHAVVPSLCPLKRVLVQMSCKRWGADE